MLDSKRTKIRYIAWIEYLMNVEELPIHCEEFILAAQQFESDSSDDTFWTEYLAELERLEGEAECNKVLGPRFVVS